MADDPTETTLPSYLKVGPEQCTELINNACIVRNFARISRSSAQEEDKKQFQTHLHLLIMFAWMSSFVSCIQDVSQQHGHYCRKWLGSCCSRLEAAPS
jgi:hypothetical protein